MVSIAIVVRLLLCMSLVVNGLAAATMFDVRSGALDGVAPVAVAAQPAATGHCHETPAAAVAIEHEGTSPGPQGCHPGLGCACDCAHLVVPAMVVLLLPHPVIDATPMPTVHPAGHRSALHSPLIRPPIA